MFHCPLGCSFFIFQCQNRSSTEQQQVIFVQRHQTTAVYKYVCVFVFAISHCMLTILYVCNKVDLVCDISIFFIYFNLLLTNLLQ